MSGVHGAKWPKEKIRSAHERFWEKVRKTETCWIFEGAGYPSYGRFRDDDMKFITATHFAWREAGKQIPQGMFLLHSCDNPPCIRPDHLRAGTQLDNLKDALLRGRQSQAKLLPADVRAIRARLTLGHRTKDIAADYGVTVRPIQYIRSGKKWGWLQ